jgi:hypothetical protein
MRPSTDGKRAQGRQDAMNRLRSHGTKAALAATVALLLGVLVLPPTDAAGAQTEDPSGVNVRILIYSGRPDPVFSLDPAADTSMLDNLRGLDKSAMAAEGFDKDTVIPAILGYKGLLISNPQREGDLPAHIAVYRGYVEVRDDAGTRFLVDENRNLETALLKQAYDRGLIDERLLKAEDISWAEPAAEEEVPEGEEEEDGKE